MLRYRSDGSLDPSFGGDGIVLADPTPTYDDGLRRRRRGRRPDHRRRRGGSRPARTGGSWRWRTSPTARSIRRSAATARSSPTSPRRPTFRSGSRSKTTARSSSRATPPGPGPEPEVRARPVRARRLARSEPSGRWDRDHQLHAATATVAYSVAIDPDGKIVAAGQAGNGGPAPRFAAVRYLADGALDPTFGGDGKVSTDLTPHFDAACRGRGAGRRVGRVLGRVRRRRFARLVRGAAVPAVAVLPRAPSSLGNVVKAIGPRSSVEKSNGFLNHVRRFDSCRGHRS